MSAMDETIRVLWTPDLVGDPPAEPGPAQSLTMFRDNFVVPEHGTPVVIAIRRRRRFLGWLRYAPILRRWAYRIEQHYGRVAPADNEP